MRPGSPSRKPREKRAAASGGRPRAVSQAWASGWAGSAAAAFSTRAAARRRQRSAGPSVARGSKAGRRGARGGVGKPPERRAGGSSRRALQASAKPRPSTSCRYWSASPPWPQRRQYQVPGIPALAQAGPPSWTGQTRKRSRPPHKGQGPAYSPPWVAAL
nr:hypothetical protein [Desulfovibrio aminophilus]